MLSIQGNMLIIIIIVTITMKCTSAVADTFCRNKFHRNMPQEVFILCPFYLTLLDIIYLTYYSLQTLTLIIFYLEERLKSSQ